ncbi:NAD-glutamate dehydrogenase domain-containing protein, partial [Micromonospora sp. WMMD736]|uniref:NAD-glutamate dehydrogenase domain-containing protein n=1 Tax=Micromonospora sp. WMMD736 TaxID=3404112 RepID=UPI003B929E57
MEVDALNELVLLAGLHWREVTVLRAYAKYLQQAGFPYSFDKIGRVLRDHPDAARLFVELFRARFDPEDESPDAAGGADAVAERLGAHIDAVVSLDVDRVLRAILGLITATLRTNFFRDDHGEHQREQLSFKFDARQITEIPEPKPLFEIFVYSPRVEGVHLRFGRVARGGLRWSDRTDDFRTEILGLVKAQAVKNAVIVPVGAKGGFIVKQPPAPTGDASGDRTALSDEATACYRKFVAALLDVTDNVPPTDRSVVPPHNVVRRDGDDTYLVLAADKGTAAFSDIANSVAAQYDFWLGDAFASGGSAGYDHKAMGITARGAWAAVERHSAEAGIDFETADFTVVGIGDMSGDVFGNGMLASEHIKLVAAFDHRHIFLDPDPDPTRSYRERRRLFELERSSWADYEASAISPGGGVYSRTAKAIPVSPEVGAVLGLDAAVRTLSSPEMIRAIMLAPVDLLWNGGVGTYVKSSAEPNAAVGDKSNDAVRVDANRLRVKIIGEGGNLGVSAAGRVEFGAAGGRINTDALDNSAGVACSDREVNIKILLEGAITDGDLARHERDQLLAAMTSEVAALVLSDNAAQNVAVGLCRSESVAAAPVHRRLLDELESRRGLNRAIEGLPSDGELDRRISQGLGLTSPELANLIAHVKLSLKADLLAGDLPGSAVFAETIRRYFPKPLRERFAAAIGRHRLRREIVATVIVNEMVDFGGLTYAFRLAEDTAATTEDAVRAFTVVSQIFDLRAIWHRIRTAQVPVAVRDDLELETRHTLDRAARWLLANRPQPIAIGADIARYRDGVGKLAAVSTESRRQCTAERASRAVTDGVSQELATEVFGLVDRYPLFDVLDIAEIADREVEEVIALYHSLADRLGIERLLEAVRRLGDDGRWGARVRLMLHDDLYSSLRALTRVVLAATEAGDSASE